MSVPDDEMAEVCETARRMLDALVAGRQEHFNALASYFDDRSKLHLFTAATFWAVQILRLAGAEQGGRVVLVDEHDEETFSGPPHIVVARHLLEATLKDESDSYFPLFAVVDGGIAATAAVWLCTTAADRIRRLLFNPN